MSEGFRPAEGGGVEVVLDVGEAAILRSLVAQILGLVEPGSTGDDPLEQALGISESTDAPEDPVLARLFPSGYTNDDEAAGEFRRLTEATLRDVKRADAEIVMETVTPGVVVLDEVQALAWLRALNDVRLALGVRLDVDEDFHDTLLSVSPDDPRYPAYIAYDWVTYLQESLVRAVD